MRNLVVSVALLSLGTVALAEGSDRGPGIPGTPDGAGYRYAVSDFDAVQLGGAASVDVQVGGAYAVRAEGPAAAFTNFRVAREDGALRIGHRYDGRENPLERQIRVHVVLPRLASAGVGGSGRMTVDAVRGTAFNGAVGGSGELALGQLEVERAKLSVGGSGRIAAAGKAAALTVSIGGSGHVDAPALRAASAQVSIGGSGTVRTRVDGPARVSMAGGGDVDLGPGAQCTTSRVGGGTVRCG